MSGGKRPGFDYDLRLFSQCSQGGRKYMEDAYCVAFHQKKQAAGHPLPDAPLGDPTLAAPSAPPTDLEYVFVGIFDGHGGKEAALYSRDNLMHNVVNQKGFWSENDEDVLKAISEGFVATHFGMLKEVGSWPRTASGLPSTAGTTASVCFIMRNKYYTGHVGDSKIVLGKKNKETKMWIPYSLTKDHKPDSPDERRRIYKAGGQVMNKSGVERVVWNRPKTGHKGPIRRSTNFDQIPFLAVARSLGDLWSYNPDSDTYVVSPEPDVEVIPMDPEEDRCLILASDGLWNMLLEHECVRMVQEIEEDDVDRVILKSVFNSDNVKPSNPSRALVSFALQRWYSSRLRADNTSVVTVLLDHRKLGGIKMTCHEMPENGVTECEVMRELIESEKESALVPAEGEGPLPAVGPVPGEMSDEEFAGLLKPVVLSNYLYGCEFKICPDNLPKPKIPHHLPLFDKNLEHSSPFAYLYNHRPISQERYSLLSPPMQSLRELAKGSDPTPELSLEGGKTETYTALKRSSLSNSFYGNELTEGCPQIMTNALKAKDENKVHKVINGVKVIRDFDEKSEEERKLDEASSLSEGNSVKKFKDEYVTATEELVDGHAMSSSGLSDNSLQKMAGIKVYYEAIKDRECRHLLARKGREEFRNKKASSFRCAGGLPLGLGPQGLVELQNVVGDGADPSEDGLNGSNRKRKFEGPCSRFSPPAKHLRSSRWSRPRISLPSSTVSRGWRALAASLLTRSRLRARMGSK